MIEYSQGSILESDAQALVVPVNCVGVMGAGLAKQFKDSFPRNYQNYRDACGKGIVRVGRVFIADPGGLTPRLWIVNFPTKDHWRAKSRMHWIESGLAHLAMEVQARGIKSIAIPALGCGLGGLKWADVLPLIEHFACAIPDVRVIVYPPER